MDSCRNKGILASIENVHISPPRPERKAYSSVAYPWHVPDRDLAERRAIADQRRSDLMGLFYQEETLSPGAAEELIREWIALLIERDKLLKEEIHQENTELTHQYVHELKSILCRMPSLRESEDDRELKDALVYLERRVGSYCSKKNLRTPEAPYRSLPVVGKASNTAAGCHGYTQATCASLDSAIAKNAPPSPPPPPPPPPPIPTTTGTSLLSRATAAATVVGRGVAGERGVASGRGVAGGRGMAVGTVQFASRATMDVGGRGGGVGRGEGGKREGEGGCDEVDSGIPPQPVPRDVMEEIVSVGQSILKPVDRTRPPRRSHGDTPARKSSGNTELLQQALINRFRSLNLVHHDRQSTPRQVSQDMSETGSFDWSGVWSDINSSIRSDVTLGGKGDDPNLTADHDTLSPPSLPSNTNSQMNSSTAV